MIEFIVVTYPKEFLMLENLLASMEKFLVEKKTKINVVLQHGDLGGGFSNW